MSVDETVPERVEGVAEPGAPKKPAGQMKETERVVAGPGPGRGPFGGGIPPFHECILRNHACFLRTCTISSQAQKRPCLSGILS